MRTCIGCRRRRPAAEMVRYVLDGDGTVVVGTRMPGRGAWLCPDGACLATAVRRRAFDKAFRTAVGRDALLGLTGPPSGTASEFSSES